MVQLEGGVIRDLAHNITVLLLDSKRGKVDD
jgi:hypothetical protein